MSTAECHDRGHTEWISSFVESTRRSTEWRGAMSYITIWSLAALSKHERFEKSLTFLTDLPADEQGQLIDSIERSRLPSDHAYQHFCQVVAGRLDSTVRGIAGKQEVEPHLNHATLCIAEYLSLANASDLVQMCAVRCLVRLEASYQKWWKLRARGRLVF